MKVNVWVAVDAVLTDRLLASIADLEGNPGNIPEGKLRVFARSLDPAVFQGVTAPNAQGDVLWNLYFTLDERNPNAIRSYVNQFFAGWQSQTDIVGCWDVASGLQIGMSWDYVPGVEQRQVRDPEWDGEGPWTYITVDVPVENLVATGTPVFPIPVNITDFLPDGVQDYLLMSGQQPRNFS